MDPTISVSQGVFVYKNGTTRASAKSNKKSTKRTRKEITPILSKNIIEQPFYKVYNEMWSKIQTHIEMLRSKNYKRILEDLVAYVSDVSLGKNNEMCDISEMLPTAALLTGINQPDHLEQFEALKQRISEKVNASVCLVQARDCSTIKASIETMVYNFVKYNEEDCDYKCPRRNQCTMKQLKLWYCKNFIERYMKNDSDVDVANVVDDDEELNDENADKNSNKSKNENVTQRLLVIILPDFECFNSQILQDFIMILCANCEKLPFVLILGIATSISAVHCALPFQVTSKINLSVFQTQAAPVGLNEILDKVILSPKYPFHLSGKAFKFLTHIFLYYDFSINGFIQGYKYCLMEHYFLGNAYALCTDYSASLSKIKSLTHEDIESIRRLLSFRPYVEKMTDCKRIIRILTEDDYLKKKLPQLLRDCQLHLILMRVFMELLMALVYDLPKYPLGQYRRELYVFFLTKEICLQPEFKECWKILSFMSKEEFVSKISKAIKITQEFLDDEISPLELSDACNQIVNEKLEKLKLFLTKVVMAGVEVRNQTTAATPTTTTSTPTTNVQLAVDSALTPNEAQLSLQKLTSRHELKQKLIQISKQQQQTKSVSEFTKSVSEVLNFIENEIIKLYLLPLSRAPPLHELFLFNDIGSVRRNIIGAPRASLHMALNNPQFYLQCKCCILNENSQLLSTLPDLSIVYKLHLECGRMINLFDWLQAFRSIVECKDNDNDEDKNDDDDGDGDDDGEDKEQIDPKIQARFTRAVAELQFLGYIKMSKRKTDHAKRLTW